MEHTDESVDVESRDLHSTKGTDTYDLESNADEDDSYSGSSGDERSETESSETGEDASDNIGAAVHSEVNFDSITSDEIRAMEFATVSEAYEFYYRYGKCKGFAIRKASSRIKELDGNKVTQMKQFVCNRHGLREKKHLTRLDRKVEHRRLSRTNCEARFRVQYRKQKDRYVVTAFVECHNHELTPARFVHLHPVYRKISEADKAQIDGLQTRGIRTCHIMGYMIAQKGGYASVGFTKKDLYNYFDKKMRECIKDGDVVASLNYLNVKSSTDPMLYAEYAVDNSNGRMRSLFWADGSSRSDYFCFGDVLAFDTTYRRNKYNYPLVVFSGCNHHSQTVIFGAALVADETTETYKWVLNCFLECMEGKQPKAVVTDGDGAMREAIKQIFPDATHRLCAWHLNKNAVENVKDNPEFLDGFQKAMYSNFTKDEFEEYWSELIKETEVEQHPWVVKTYENRSLWATGYLRDQFFGRIRTTSQCEAVNAIIKTYVRTKGCIFEFMHNFDQVLRDYRNNELEADFKSKFTVPVLTTQLRVIESDAANTYTAEIFKEVKEQILKAGALIVKHKSDHGDTKIYTLTKFCNDTYERKVVFDGTTLQCSCKLFDSRGVPCSHIFYVMKDEHVDHIPRPLVLSRWTKDAKIEYLNNMECNGDVDSNVVEEARFGAYCSAFTSFCKEAAKKNGVYGQILDDIMKLQKKYCINDDPIIGTQNPAVGDPVAVKSKGAPKKKKKEPKSVRRCGKCNATTHNARTCSEGTQKATEPIVDLQSVSISDAISQMDEKKKRKATCNVDRSVQKKGSRPPIHRGAKATVTTQADTNGCYNQMHFQAQMDVTGTSRHLNAMCGVQPVMPMVPQMFQPMHLQPVYPMYGMSVGQTASSCYGMLQQSVGQSSRSCYSLLQQVEKAATDD
ncbi:unnamed protein product [Trifolium pratense]|uniref:Uncharacterized protein n=1 Tax=Trifolium pratense TaxID=57577 RepID=A0ACB0JGP0_TRIPR|nr:unnamed protein product [Trifolium pratense]